MSKDVTSETVSTRLTGFSETDRQWLAATLENAGHDDAMLDGLHLYLDIAANARFLNALKLEKAGEWLGNNAPGRLQIRLMEAARSSQHAAFQSFRQGLVRSGGLERAYPKSAL